MRTKHHVGFVLVVAMVGGPSPVREFVDAIPVGTSPGLAADLLIRVARAPAAAAEGRAWQQALYEKAIELSSAIDEPFPTVPLPGTHTDTRDGVASSGASLGVDALSVRVRATQGLLSLAPSAALDVARQMRSSVSALTCRDTLVPDVSPLFELAQSLATESAARRRRRGPDDETFEVLEGLVQSIDSSLAIGPALRFVQRATLTPDQSRTILVDLAGILASLSDGDVAFTASLDSNWTNIKKIVEVGDDPVQSVILRAFRQFVVNHVGAERCGGLGLNAEQVAAHRAKTLQDIDAVMEAHGLARLSKAETTPIRVVPAAPVVEFWRSSKSSELFRELKRLKFNGRKIRTAADKQTPAWFQDLDRFLAMLNTWTPRDEASPADYFFERSLLSEALVDVVPPGDARDRVLTDFVTYLAASESQFHGSAWLFRVRLLIDRHRSTERAWVLGALRRSGDSTMRAYAQLEDVLAVR
ncbi:MAG TPA: hypothetical protein VFA59_06670 [Vicinamibacterales bacterium]|nr:hypothetical protein [Vicinamibacterales bacterium]